jgi:hypothetical protein
MNLKDERTWYMTYKMTNENLIIKNELIESFLISCCVWPSFCGSGYEGITSLILLNERMNQHEIRELCVLCFYL